MAKKPETWRIKLGEAVRRAVFPALAVRGFASPKDTEKNFHSFQRARADGGYDLLEIQFDKNARPFFFINLGIASAQGVTLPAQGHITAADVRIYHLAVQARFKKPFSLSWLARWLRPKTACDDAAQKAVQALTEAEKWFAHPDTCPASIRAHDYSDVIERMKQRAR